MDNKFKIKYNNKMSKMKISKFKKQIFLKDCNKKIKNKYLWIKIMKFKKKKIEKNYKIIIMMN